MSSNNINNSGGSGGSSNGPLSASFNEIRRITPLQRALPRKQCLLLKTGWLKKAGEHWSLKRKRFFVLQDLRLFYFKSEISMQNIAHEVPLGVISLTDCVTERSSESGSQSCFTLKAHQSFSHGKESFNFRTYTFIASDEADMVSWLTALQKSKAMACLVNLEEQTEHHRPEMIQMNFFQEIPRHILFEIQKSISAHTLATVAVRADRRWRESIEGVDELWQFLSTRDFGHAEAKRVFQCCVLLALGVDIKWDNVYEELQKIHNEEQVDLVCVNSKQVVYEDIQSSLPLLFIEGMRRTDYVLELPIGFVALLEHRKKLSIAEYQKQLLQFEIQHAAVLEKFDRCYPPDDESSGMEGGGGSASQSAPLAISGGGGERSASPAILSTTPNSNNNGNNNVNGNNSKNGLSRTESGDGSNNSYMLSSDGQTPRVKKREVSMPLQGGALVPPPSPRVQPDAERGAGDRRETDGKKKRPKMTSSEARIGVHRRLLQKYIEGDVQLHHIYLKKLARLNRKLDKDTAVAGIKKTGDKKQEDLDFIATNAHLQQLIVIGTDPSARHSNGSFGPHGEGLAAYIDPPTTNTTNNSNNGKNNNNSNNNNINNSNDNNNKLNRILENVQLSDIHKVYNNVTVGAFAAHTLGFKDGGVRQLEKVENELRNVLGRWTESEELGVRKMLKIVSKLAQLRWMIEHRRSICISQALPTVVSCFLHEMRRKCTDPDFWDQIEHVGFLLLVTGLLSTWNDESGMLGDAEACVRSLRMVLFSLEIDEDLSPLDSESAGAPPPPQSVFDNGRHRARVELLAQGGRMIVRLLFHPKDEILPFIPKRFVERDSRILIRVCPVMLNMGINEWQRVAELVGSKVRLQVDINIEGVSTLARYFFSYSRHLLSKLRQSVGGSGNFVIPPSSPVSHHHHHHRLSPTSPSSSPSHQTNNGNSSSNNGSGGNNITIIHKNTRKRSGAACGKDLVSTVSRTSDLGLPLPVLPSEADPRASTGAVSDEGGGGGGGGERDSRDGDEEEEGSETERVPGGDSGLSDAEGLVLRGGGIVRRKAAPGGGVIEMTTRDSSLSPRPLSGEFWKVISPPPVEIGKFVASDRDSGENLVTDDEDSDVSGDDKRKSRRNLKPDGAKNDIPLIQPSVEAQKGAEVSLDGRSLIVSRSSGEDADVENDEEDSSKPRKKDSLSVLPADRKMERGASILVVAPSLVEGSSENNFPDPTGGGGSLQPQESSSSTTSSTAAATAVICDDKNCPCANEGNDGEETNNNNSANVVAVPSEGAAAAAPASPSKAAAEVSLSSSPPSISATPSIPLRATTAGEVQRVSSSMTTASSSSASSTASTISSVSASSKNSSNGLTRTISEEGRTPSKTVGAKPAGKGIREGGGGLSVAVTQGNSLVRLNEMIVAFNLQDEADKSSIIAGLRETAKQLDRLETALTPADDGKKNSRTPELLELASDWARSLCAGRITMCKSAKDRTSMFVTAEQARFVCNRHGVPPDQLQQTLDMMRAKGTRISNVRDNCTSGQYAFNKLQWLMLPETYRPPEKTYGFGTKS